MASVDQRVDLVEEARRTLDATRVALKLPLQDKPSPSIWLQEARRAWRLASFRTRAWLADRASGDPYLETTRLFSVPTSSLRHQVMVTYDFTPISRPGAVVPGDWDLVGDTMEESPYWVEYREALRGERQWCETELYGSLMRKAKGEDNAWRRRVFEAEAERSIRDYERLYDSMCKNGCLPQHELARKKGPGYRPYTVDDISVGVGRTGELLRWGGAHRLEAARALGIEAVPVWIGMRHSEWWAFRRRVVAYAQAHGGKVPERLCHPDLETIPFSFDCGAVLTPISTALGGEAGAVVDAAPGWGSLLHGFEQLGFSAVGLSPDPGERMFLERLRDANERSFRVIDDPCAADAVCERCAAVLLLRGADRRLAAADERERVVELLRRVRPRHVFLDCSNGYGEACGGRAADCPSPAVRLCAEAAGLQNVEVLPGDGATPLYHLHAPAVA